MRPHTAGSGCSARHEKSFSVAAWSPARRHRASHLGSPRISGAHDARSCVGSGLCTTGINCTGRPAPRRRAAWRLVGTAVQRARDFVGDLSPALARRGFGRGSVGARGAVTASTRPPSLPSTWYVPSPRSSNPFIIINAHGGLNTPGVGIPVPKKVISPTRGCEGSRSTWGSGTRRRARSRSTRVRSLLTPRGPVHAGRHNRTSRPRVG